jgi:hypothetical protein
MLHAGTRGGERQMRWRESKDKWRVITHMLHRASRWAVEANKNATRGLRAQGNMDTRDSAHSMQTNIFFCVCFHVQHMQGTMPGFFFFWGEGNGQQISMRITVDDMNDGKWLIKNTWCETRTDHCCLYAIWWCCLLCACCPCGVDLAHVVCLSIERSGSCYGVRGEGRWITSSSFTISSLDT